MPEASAGGHTWPLGSRSLAGPSCFLTPPHLKTRGIGETELMARGRRLGGWAERWQGAARREPGGPESPRADGVTPEPSDSPGCEAPGTGAGRALKGLLSASPPSARPLKEQSPLTLTPAFPPGTATSVLTAGGPCVCFCLFLYFFSFTVLSSPHKQSFHGAVRGAGQAHSRSSKASMHLGLRVGGV